MLVCHACPEHVVILRPNCLSWASVYFQSSSWHDRNSQGLDELLQKPGTLISEYKDNIHVTQDPATAGISSTQIRKELGQVKRDAAGCKTC